MGLDISLIKITNYFTSDLTFLPEDENPELEGRYGHLKRLKKVDYGQSVEPVQGYYYEELGKQRKGVKTEFYQRYGPDEFIFTKAGLDELTRYVDGEYLNSFMGDIVEKFKEGDTIVIMGY